MMSRLIAPLALAATVLAGPAMAASYGHSIEAQNNRVMAAAAAHDECATLEMEFDKAVGARATSSRTDDAKVLRSDGGQLCAAGKSGAGIAKLKSALKDIGVPPEA